MNENLIKPIKERISAGITKEDIKKEVIEQGYTEEEFESAFAEASTHDEVVPQKSESFHVNEDSNKKQYKGWQLHLLRNLMKYSWILVPVLIAVVFFPIDGSGQFYIYNKLVYVVLFIFIASLFVKVFRTHQMTYNVTVSDNESPEAMQDSARVPHHIKSRSIFSKRNFKLLGLFLLNFIFLLVDTFTGAGFSFYKIFPWITEPIASFYNSSSYGSEFLIIYFVIPQIVFILSFIFLLIEITLFLNYLHFVKKEKQYQTNMYILNTIVVVILFFSFFAQGATCIFVPTEKGQNDCFHHFVYEKALKNKSKCQKIENTETRNSCLVSACNIIKVNSARDECFKDIGVEYNEIEFCNLSDDDRKQGQCYERIANDTANAELCDKISDLSMKNSCYRSIVEKVPDSSLCAKITADDTANQCYYNVAKATTDATHCSKIKDTEIYSTIKNDCYYELAIETSNSELCKYIQYDVHGPNINRCKDLSVGPLEDEGKPSEGPVPGVDAEMVERAVASKHSLYDICYDHDTGSCAPLFRRMKSRGLLTQEELAQMSKKISIADRQALEDEYNNPNTSQERQFELATILRGHNFTEEAKSKRQEVLNRYFDHVRSELEKGTPYENII